MGVVVAAYNITTFSRSIVVLLIWVLGREYAQTPNLKGLRFFYKPEISDSGPPGGLVLRIFTILLNVMFLQCF